LPNRSLDSYEELSASGQSVMIDGLCALACTIVLAALPRDKICVTSKANLVFHAAWDIGIHGRTITNLEATRVLCAIYLQVSTLLLQHTNSRPSH
jgi:hypothetical protein